MNDLPVWFQGVLQQRFDALSVQGYQNPDLDSVRTKLQETLSQMKEQFSKAQWALFLEWEGYDSYLSGMEKEWMYWQGLQDGAGMQLSLIHTQIKRD